MTGPGHSFDTSIVQRAIKAFHTIVRLARNLAFDLRYGGFSGGTVEARTPGARATGNTDYAVMKQLFEGRIEKNDVLVDVGCGKGRVINWWLRYHGKNRIFGLELLEEVAAATQRRLRRYPNVRIVAGDAIANLPEEGTLFFLFNPFDAAIMTRFKARLAEMCRGRSRPPRVLYYAPLHLEVFGDDPDWKVTVHPVTPTKAGKFEERHARLAEIRWNGVETRPN